MWDFKFDAPQYFNFFRKQKTNTKIELDPDDANDQWFMIEHVELTPVKEAMTQNQETKPMPKQPNNTKIPKQIEKVDKKREISTTIHQNAEKNNEKKAVSKPKFEKLKRVHINQKFNRSTSNSEVSNSIPEFPRKRTQQPRPINTDNSKSHPISNPISKSKSQSEFTFYQKNRIRIPCPYSRKVQKDWQQKSSKSWYSLSETSAKKALNSMKKMVKDNKKSPKKDKPRFKF